MNKANHTLKALMLLIAVVIAGATLVVAAPKTGSFSRTGIIIEVNGSAGDAGIQISVDAPGWTRLEIFDPNGQKVFEGIADGSVEVQGVSEFFFESSEPPFDEVPLADFLLRFPAGMYTFAGTTGEGQALSGKATLSHSIPDTPVITSPAEGAVLDPAAPVVVAWEPVDDPFPGTDLAVNIVSYQVIVERVKPQPVRVFSVFLPGTATQVTVSPEFMQARAEYNIEVLAIDAGGNQTIAEHMFKTK